VRVVEDRADDDAGAPYVGDEDRVRQIVLNLLSNAVKFTPAGGVVTVGYDTVADTPGRARLHGAGPWSCVRVQDTGVGIAPEEQGRIFAPFHQVEGGHTRRAGGTGLGLTISRQLARLMGGDLTVESAAGEGSTFTLWLPAARRAAARPGVGGEAETAAARAARAAPAGRILDAPELAEIGAVLRDVVDDVLAAYADRLRADPHTPWARTMRRPEIEDHQVSLLGDLAQSLVIVGAAGPEAEVLLADGSAIQRTIALHHGARRHAQGWSEPGMRRDYQVLREEVARAVRGRLGAERPGLDDALRVVTGLIDRAEAVSVGAWRRAAAVDG
jgi:hypothetical protein